MDLPSNAPQMFQLHGPENVPMPGGPFQQLAAGLGQGMQVGQQQQALQQHQQALQQEQQKMEIEKNMKMLETGSQMVLEGGPGVQDTGRTLIQKAYPFLTGNPMPEGVQIDKEQAKDLGWYMDQHRLFQTSNGAEGMSAQDAVTGATQAMSQYGSKYQERQMGLLEKTPMYKEGMANQVGGVANGQPATKNEFTGDVTSSAGKPMPGAQGNFVDSGQAATLNNEKAQSLGRTFLETTKDQQQTLPDLVDFTTSMAPRLPENATDQDKADLVAHQKIGLLKYMQMQVPASRRPPNLQAMDSISKEDLIAAHAEQAFKRLFVNGAPLSDEMQESILKNGAQTGLTSEARLTDAESSWANSAKQNGVDPSKAFQNLRPSGIPSSSKLFPSKGPTAMTAHVGQIVVGKSGAHIYRGGDRSDPKNWTAVK